MTQSSSLDSRELWAMIKIDYPDAVIAEKESFYAVCPQPDAPPATRWLLSEQQAMEEFLEWDTELQNTAARIEAGMQPSTGGYFGYCPYCPTLLGLDHLPEKCISRPAVQQPQQASEIEQLFGLYLAQARRLSEALGKPFAGDPTKTVVDLFDLAIAKLAEAKQPAPATPQPQPLPIPLCNPTPADYQAASMHVLGVESYPEYQCRVRQLREQLPFVQETAKFDSDMLVSNMRIERRDVELRIVVVKTLAALREARQTIRLWHGESAWEIYDTRSPEMQKINDAIALAGEALIPPAKTGESA